MKEEEEDVLDIKKEEAEINDNQDGKMIEEDEEVDEFVKFYIIKIKV